VRSVCATRRSPARCTDRSNIRSRAANQSNTRYIGLSWSRGRSTDSNNVITRNKRQQACPAAQSCGCAACVCVCVCGSVGGSHPSVDTVHNDVLLAR